MTEPRVVSREQWLVQRKELLEREKALTRLRDETAALRRALPWVRVTQPYRFVGPDGPRTLAELFDGRSQLIVDHFMFGPDWREGCPICSFWADNFEGLGVHLAQRDATLVVVSRAPYEVLAAYRQRMGWTFPWYSSLGSAFNFDFQVSYTPEQVASGSAEHNHRATRVFAELPGLSVFARDEAGGVFHTYSTYARGLDTLNAAYQLMDLLPKGRDEQDLPWPMAWVRRHDQYPGR
jgi:predicted dithiol-disulfide oxidoreductase (DUF899 family)